MFAACVRKIWWGGKPNWSERASDLQMMQASNRPKSRSSINDYTAAFFASRDLTFHGADNYDVFSKLPTLQPRFFNDVAGCGKYIPLRVYLS